MGECWVNRRGHGQKRTKGRPGSSEVGAVGCTLICVPALHLYTPRPCSESLYQLLSQTTPENMHRNVAQYGLDPATRYPNLNLRSVSPNQVRPSLEPAADFPGQTPSQVRPAPLSEPSPGWPLPKGCGLCGQPVSRPERGCLRCESCMTWWPRSPCRGMTRQTQESWPQVSRPSSRAASKTRTN